MTLERPLITPLAHDAMSARLIERAGFKAFAVGGSAMLAARYGLPDIGLIGLSDMADGLRDIASASTLPFMADGDDCYGDVKNVARLIRVYEAIGVGGVLIEDQERDAKQQRAERASQVADEAVILEKLRVAMKSRDDPDMFIIGRTDAYGPLGLDAAIGRAEKFLEIGVDGVFVAGLTQMSDYEEVGRRLNGAWLSAAMFGGGSLPWIAPETLGEMGFSQISYPAYLIARAALAMDDGLAELRRETALGAAPPSPKEFKAARKVLDAAVALDEWRRVGG